MTALIEIVKIYCTEILS